MDRRQGFKKEKHETTLVPLFITCYIMLLHIITVLVQQFQSFTSLRIHYMNQKGASSGRWICTDTNNQIHI